jgi:hypothetical protein
MPNDGYKEVFNGLLETYISLDESAETIVRRLKKTPKPEPHCKTIAEIRNLEEKRLELLVQMDNLAKST